MWTSTLHRVSSSWLSSYTKLSLLVRHVPNITNRFYCQNSDEELLWLRAVEYGKRTAIIDNHGSYTYHDLLAGSFNLSQSINNVIGNELETNPSRVAFLCPNNASYTLAQWAIWRSGGTAVPLCKTHPLPEIEYVIRDSQSSLVITTDEFHEKVMPLVKKLGISCLRLSDMNLHQIKKSTSTERTYLEHKLEKDDWFSRDAMILYTSGTTGRPKGVLINHANIRYQITALTEAWGWTSDDVILHVLPLHHVHGVINVLACPLWCGATCYMMPSFQPEQVWQFLMGEREPQLSLFMAVPTIYAKLIEHWRINGWGDDKEKSEKIKEKCQRLRLMVSGSAALPEPVMQQWENITGHRLLERYGMTEIGMALSNPLKGERKSGCVGTPLPRVQCRIVVEAEDGSKNVACVGDYTKTDVVPGMEGKVGELQINGPLVFQRYWNKPKATADAFTEDGWFKSGDTCVYKDGVYKILGRTSVDIIKSGGYKMSALDIERHLLTHSDIIDCAVVGVEDIVWGQIVGAVLVCKDGKILTAEDVRTWAKDILPSYQIPRLVKCLDSMPRNVMGKVNKKGLVKVFREQ